LTHLVPPCLSDHLLGSLVHYDSSCRDKFSISISFPGTSWIQTLGSSEVAFSGPFSSLDLHRGLERCLWALIIVIYIYKFAQRIKRMPASIDTWLASGRIATPVW
jgi:hypothetical protein